MIAMPQHGPPPDLALMGVFEPTALEAIAQNKTDSSKPQTTAQKESASRSAQKEERLREKEDRLQGKKGSVHPPPVSVPPPPPPPPPNPVDKSTLLDKIDAYRKRFPGLKKRNNVSIKSHIEECQDELHYIEMQLGSADGNDGVAAMMFVSAMNVAETITTKYYNPMGLRLEGLTQVSKDNMNQIVPILDELMIKYATGMYVGPETRLVMTVGAMMATVHAANSGDPRTADILSRASEVVAPPKGSESL